LIGLGLWNESFKQRLIAANGSVQNFPELNDKFKLKHRTVFEMSQKSIIDMAADRGIYIDQSQSLNIHMLNVNFGKLTSMHFYAWKKGLKTGMYYLRSKPAVDAIKFTVDVKTIMIEQQQQLSLMGQPKTESLADQVLERKSEPLLRANSDIEDHCPAEAVTYDIPEDVEAEELPKEQLEILTQMVKDGIPIAPETPGSEEHAKFLELRQKTALELSKKPSKQPLGVPLLLEDVPEDEVNDVDEIAFRKRQEARKFKEQEIEQCVLINGKSNCTACSS